MASDIKLDFFYRIEFFAKLELEALKLLFLASEELRFDVGDIVFQRGDRSDGGYVITSGQITLYQDEFFAAAVFVAGPGVLLGELSLISDTERAVNAIVTEATSVLRISRGSFKRVLQEYPSSAECLRLQVSHRLAAFIGDLKLIA
jgi:CRP-like cAMP-binding protein